MRFDLQDDPDDDPEEDDEFGDDAEDGDDSDDEGEEDDSDVETWQVGPWSFEGQPGDSAKGRPLLDFAP